MTLRTRNYGNYGIFLIMGDAGFTSSTVVHSSLVIVEDRYTGGTAPGATKGLSGYPYTSKNCVLHAVSVPQPLTLNPKPKKRASHGALIEAVIGVVDKHCSQKPL